MNNRLNQVEITEISDENIKSSTGSINSILNELHKKEQSYLIDDRFSTFSVSRFTHSSSNPSHKNTRDYLKIIFFFCFLFDLVSISIYVIEVGTDDSTWVTLIFLFNLFYHYQNNQWCVIDGTIMAQEFKHKHKISIIFIIIILIIVSILSMSYDIPFSVLIAYIFARASISIMVIITVLYQINTMSFIKLFFFKMKYHKPFYLDKNDSNELSDEYKKSMLKELKSQKEDIELLKIRLRKDTYFNIGSVTIFIILCYRLLVLIPDIFIYVMFLFVSLLCLVSASSIHTLMHNQIIDSIENTLNVKTKMHVKLLFWTPRKSIFVTFFVTLLLGIYRLILFQ